MRGAPMNEAIADDTVAATMPTTMSGGTHETRCIPLKSATSPSAGIAPPKAIAAPK